MSIPGPPPPSPLKQQWRRFRDGLLDMVYPAKCRSCEVPMEQQVAGRGLAGWLCQACREELVKVEPPYCSVCGEPFGGAMDRAFRCSNCEGRRLAFEFAVAGYKAAGPLREIIHRFKYNGDLSLRGVLAESLMDALHDPRLEAENLAGWVLVPVPLHWFREFRRDYNQSWELCLELSALTGIPAGHVLRRTRRSAAQARLNRQERLENLRGVFALHRWWSLPWRRTTDIRGKKVLLVDDVLTTGATAHECARVLRRDAGAEKVVVITAARG